MKILHLIYDHPNNPWVGGGGARRVDRMARLLAERGHELRLLSGRFPRCSPEHTPRLRWDFLGRPWGYFCSTVSYAVSAFWWTRRHAHIFDVVIEDFAPWNPVFTYALKAPPAVIQIQNRLGAAIVERYPLLGHPLVRFEMNYPKRFRHGIVINESLRRSYQIDAEVISMGVEGDLLERSPQEGAYIACLGRIDFHQKGLDLLLEAARKRQLPLQIAGDGPDRPRLRSAIARSDHIRWLGPLEGEAKVAFLLGAKMVVIPSRYEGQNLVALEAAALGKPLIVSDIDELRYTVEHGFALDFPTGSVEALAGRMKELWNDASLRDRLASHGRPFVRPLTWERVTAQMERYLESVIESADLKRRPTP